MKTLRDIPISLTPEYVLREQYRREQAPARPWLLDAAREAVDLGRPLVAPAVVYDEFPVRAVTGEQVILARDGPDGETTLTVGPKTDLLAPAERVLVAVLTIGPTLEQKVRALSAEGRSVLAYMLDCVGVLALGEVGEAVRRLAEERASAVGWGVGPALSPGSLVGWPLWGQRELCALLPLDEIGVRLSDGCVLEPLKSVSVLVGLGPGYESRHVGSVCRYCALADTCWRRREDAT